MGRRRRSLGAVIGACALFGASCSAPPHVADNNEQPAPTKQKTEIGDAAVLDRSDVGPDGQLIQQP